MAILLDILTENKAKYMQMFLPLGEEVANTAYVRTNIKWARQALKKEDRIVWYLRFLRLGVVAQFAFKQQPVEISEEHTKKLIDFYKKEIDNLYKSGQLSSPQEGADIGSEALINGRLKTNLTHIAAMSEIIPEMDKLIFGRKDVSSLFQEANEIENHWKSQREENSLEEEDLHTVVLKFSDGSAWFNLNASSCSDEARAMGHCGNSQGFYSDTILSFRTPLGERWVPHLTFILDEDGQLGEMKGRGNEKPAKRYHPYIVELLRLPMITGLKGGGYLPQNNFSFDDLDEREKQSLYEEKPVLASNSFLLGKIKEDPNILPELVKRVTKVFYDFKISKDKTSDVSLETKLYYDKFTDVTDMIKDIFGERSNMYHLAKIINGEDHIDVWYDRSTKDVIEFASNSLSYTQIEAIANHFGIKYDEDEHDTEEKLLKFMIEENAEVESLLDMALFRGDETGYMDDAYDKFKNNLSFEFLNKTFTIVEDHETPRIEISLKDAIELMGKPEFQEYTDEEHGEFYIMNTSDLYFDLSDIDDQTMSYIEGFSEESFFEYFNEEGVELPKR